MTASAATYARAAQDPRRRDPDADAAQRRRPRLPLRPQSRHGGRRADGTADPRRRAAEVDHLDISSPGWGKHAWSKFFSPFLAQATVFVVNCDRFDESAPMQVMDAHSEEGGQHGYCLTAQRRSSNVM